MIDFTSTPIILIALIGSVGMLLPVINIIRKDRGSTSFYGAIALVTLIVAAGFVAYQIFTDNVASPAIFSEDVLVDDTFGSFFAIVVLIVAILTVVGSFDYMRKQPYPAVYFSLILLSSIGMIGWLA